MNNHLKLGSLLFNKRLPTFKILTNSLYSYQVSERALKNTRVTRPKVSKNLSIPLTYEQTQFVENIGVTKSWNSWNTCN